jgi:hypothetical protein
MGGFSTSPTGKKTDNGRGAFSAKIGIRRNVMAALEQPAHVFDAFAGMGEIHGAIWKDAASYCGCELKDWQRDGRLMFVADNRRVMRSIDLKAYNLFDLDAYGSPWEQAMIIADRRPVPAGERLGMILTEGAGLAYKTNVVPAAVRELGGIKQWTVGLYRKQDGIIDRMLDGLARRMRCSIEKRWQAKGRTGAAMVYIGIVLRGLAVGHERRESAAEGKQAPDQAEDEIDHHQADQSPDHNIDRRDDKPDEADGRPG